MKISQLKISNFRSYKDEVIISFNNLTAFVGKNDTGKSTILEALDVFFNEGKTTKIEKEDINKQLQSKENTEIRITVVFENLPDELIIDDTNPTNLKSEYLLNSKGELEVIKVYPNAGKEKVYVKANHPTNPECSALLLKKQNELQGIIKKQSIKCEDLKKNADMRKAIWNHYSDNLDLSEIEIDVTKEDAKKIWEQLKAYMPLYSLFQSDRKNSDGDSEIQDPMKLAVQEILKESNIQNTLNQVASEVNSKLQGVASRTLEKLKEMNPEIANSLNPVLPSVESLKWADVFKGVTILGDDDIPINKRGSGVKRLVLLNFFRAEAEHRKAEKNVPHIIYAIEEPETSQHPEHQIKLIRALIELSRAKYTQIILTTHSPAIVKLLDFDHLKLIKCRQIKEIINIEKHSLPYPSLNEVNFLAFNESDEGYHNELYGYIESEKWLEEFQVGKETRLYKKQEQNRQREYEVILSKYIRHQIHHPENKLNSRFTSDELLKSIQDMRNFIVGKGTADQNHPV